MAPQQRSLVPGIILIAIGILFLLPRLFHIHLTELWPMFILGGGIAFYIGFFADRSNYGLLMPATILTVIGLLFFYCTIEGWFLMETLWPVFMIAPGLGFALMYLLGKQEQGLLIPAGILIFLGAFFLLSRTDYDYLWPLLLVLLGLFLLLSPKKTSGGS